MTGRLLALGLAVLVVAGCGSSRSSAPLPLPGGPPGIVRVGLAGLRWPLDPALVEGRDRTQLARTLYSTPFRAGPGGALRPGLCSRPRSADLRTWDFTCREAAAIAAELRRVAALPAAPSRWMFADAQIEARGDTLHVVLDRPWERFPLALTAVAAAPPNVAGPFRVVSASPRRIVAERRGLRVVFTRVEPHAAALAFRRGDLDEAPVALGDIRAARLDPALRGMARVRPLLGVDLVAFDSGVPEDVRRVYRLTADRDAYRALVPEFAAPAAFGLTAGAPATGAAAVRAARARIRSLAQVPVRVAAPPGLRYEAGLAVAAWRDQGLGASVGGARPDAAFRRVIAPYPAPEALLGQALGGTAADTVVPLAWVADARLVAPRLRGWRRDRLGFVDYGVVRSQSGRSPR